MDTSIGISKCLSTERTVTSTAKYKIGYSEKFGRYMVATKPLAAGDIILREEPAAVGPSIYENQNFCFACMRTIQNSPMQYYCSKCKVVPLCGPACEKIFMHHTTDECNLFRSGKNVTSKAVPQILQILLPLRLWLIKLKDNETWTRIKNMESHIDKRRGTNVWMSIEMQVINAFEEYKLHPENVEDPTEFLQFLSGILDVNSFEVRSPGDAIRSTRLLRGLYVEAALMAHSCKANTHVTIDENFLMTIYASVPINKDDAIFFNYTSCLLGSAERREHLRHGKYFECECTVCKDPREDSSNLSSLLCPRCKEGFVVIKNPLTTDPYSRRSSWKCCHCQKQFHGNMIKYTLDIARSLVDDTDPEDLKETENLLSKLSRSLHTNHYLMLILKQRLLAAYKRYIRIMDLDSEILQKAVNLCNEVLNVLDIVEPGISRLKEIAADELVSRLEEAADILRAALKILLLDPIATPEGRLAKCALQELKSLMESIADAKILRLTETKKKMVLED
ncbi:protein msta isoform X2 [Cephus cinctus]|uniref:Protein msta isoform X2 n=1 Tax=Cephus cinctus TaxID=211228 RepID=A0AAJ7RBQ6_CEPCN|nr:protein msta isoform X2 [Cephus cinctus]